MKIDPQYLALIIAVLAHAGASIWWAAKIDTTMNFLQKNLQVIADAIIKHEATMYSKDEAIKDFSQRDHQISALWQKVDKLQGA